MMNSQKKVNSNQIKIQKRQVLFHQIFIFTEGGQYGLYEDLPIALTVINRNFDIIFYNKMCQSIVSEIFGQDIQIAHQIKGAIKDALIRCKEQKNQFSPSLLKKGYQLIQYEFQNSIKRRNSSINQRIKNHSSSIVRVNYSQQFSALKSSVKEVESIKIIESPQRDIYRDQLKQIFDGLDHDANEKHPNNQRKEKYEQYTFQYKNNGKYKTIQWSFQKPQQDPNILLISILDITNKVKCQNEQFKHKFSSMLLNSFSHELRTPLNCSIQLLELLQENCKIEETLKDYIKPTLNANKLLLHQINDILDYASFESNNFFSDFNQFKLGSILQQIEEIYEVAFKQKNLQFKHKLQLIDGNEIIYNDMKRITQIVVNLINNCIKFTNDNGKIKIIIKQKNNNLYKIIVKDNGIGIEKDHLAVLQSTFVHTDDQILLNGGANNLIYTGLGLKIANLIAQKLTLDKQNTLHLKSQVSMFTKVSFLVQNFKIEQSQYRKVKKVHIQPLQGEDELSKEFNVSLFSSQALETKIVELNTQRGLFKNKFCQCNQILIVDDVPFNHQALKLMLKSFNLSSTSVYDGEQAINLVKDTYFTNQCCKSYKLILMDIEMPIKNGFQATKEVALNIHTNSFNLLRSRSFYKNKIALVIQLLQCVPRMIVMNKDSKGFHLESMLFYLNQLRKLTLKISWINLISGDKIYCIIAFLI